MKYHLLISGQLIPITSDQAYQLSCHSPKYLTLDKTGYIIPIWQKPSEPRHNDFKPRYITLGEFLEDLETGLIICKMSY